MTENSKIFSWRKRNFLNFLLKIWNWPFLMKQFYQRAFSNSSTDWLNLFELLSKSFHFQKSLVTVRSLSAETHPIFIIIISKTPYLYLKPSQVQMSGLDEWYLIHVSSSSLFHLEHFNWYWLDGLLRQSNQCS